MEERHARLRVVPNADHLLLPVVARLTQRLCRAVCAGTDGRDVGRVSLSEESVDVRDDAWAERGVVEQICEKLVFGLGGEGGQ